MGKEKACWLPWVTKPGVGGGEDMKDNLSLGYVKIKMSKTDLNMWIWGSRKRPALCTRYMNSQPTNWLRSYHVQEGSLLGRICKVK